jgi:glycosyltransferase involved in cell wall biosynthesis
MSRPLRVLHLGNVANNGYLNAKLLRREGVEADALCDEWHMISQPEWEDAPIEWNGGDPEAPLMGAAAAAGWRRPEWVLSPRRWDPTNTHETWLRTRGGLALEVPRLGADYSRLRRRYEMLRAVHGTSLRLTDVLRAGAWLARLGRQFGDPRRLFGSYDLVQAYGIHPILLLIAAPGKPFVTFEHGTMRELPFQDSWYGRLLSLAYREAAKVIITNPDVVAAARRLGLEDFVFVPHPVDEAKYRPGRSELRRELDAEDWDFVLLCPSRHDWDIKGTDRMLRAFAELVRRDRPRALLLLNEWGLEIGRSRALIAELGVEGNVRWIPPLPKLRLIDAYRAADVVLDQFLIGTFGAVAPEAMACGRPVLMAFDAALHEWCFPELPPVVDVRTSEQIYRELSGLASDERARDELGRAGRDWVERQHGWRLVVDRLLAIYDEVLTSSAGAWTDGRPLYPQGRE